MDFAFILDQIKHRYPVQNPSPDGGKKQAAVLIILFERSRACQVVMIKRAGHLSLHPGEIGFPGGTFERKDGDFASTALRETEEEIGLKLTPASVIGFLQPVQTLSGYKIHPFIAGPGDGPMDFRLNPEVEEILFVPLPQIFRSYEPDPRFPKTSNMAVYRHGPHRIWGASARLLKQMEDLFREP